jgi:hypothetical protein
MGPEQSDADSAVNGMCLRKRSHGSCNTVLQVHRPTLCLHLRGQHMPVAR